MVLFQVVSIKCREISPVGDVWQDGKISTFVFIVHLCCEGLAFFPFTHEFPPLPPSPPLKTQGELRTHDNSPRKLFSTRIKLGEFSFCKRRTNLFDAISEIRLYVWGGSRMIMERFPYMSQSSFLSSVNCVFAAPEKFGFELKLLCRSRLNFFEFARTTSKVSDFCSV